MKGLGVLCKEKSGMVGKGAGDGITSGSLSGDGSRVGKGIGVVLSVTMSCSIISGFSSMFGIVGNEMEGFKLDISGVCSWKEWMSSVSKSRSVCISGMRTKGEGGRS